YSVYVTKEVLVDHGVEQRLSYAQQLGLVYLRGTGRPTEPDTAEAPDMAEDEHGQRHIGDDHPQERFEYCRRVHDRSPVTSLSGMKVCCPPAEQPPGAGADEP